VLWNGIFFIENDRILSQLDFPIYDKWESFYVLILWVHHPLPPSFFNIYPLPSANFI